MGAPSFCFLFALAIWVMFLFVNFVRRMEPGEAYGSFCLPLDLLIKPNASDWSRYVLHILVVDGSWFRTWLMSTSVMILGYCLELQVGTTSFYLMFLALHLLSTVGSLFLKLTGCVASFETTMTALAVAMHWENPQIHAHAVDPGIRVPFVIEPRWHLWILEMLMVMTCPRGPVAALQLRGLGLLVGLFWVLREPAAWSGMMEFAWSKPRRMFLLNVALLLAGTAYLPLSFTELSWEQFSGASSDGRLLQWTWWQQLPSTPPLLGLNPPTDFVLSAVFGSSVMVFLSPEQIGWGSYYAYALLILVISAMCLPFWHLPHLGFFIVLYLIYGFYAGPYEEGSRSKAGYKLQ